MNASIHIWSIHGISVMKKRYQAPHYGPEARQVMNVLECYKQEKEARKLTSSLSSPFQRVSACEVNEVDDTKRRDLNINEGVLPREMT